MREVIVALNYVSSATALLASRIETGHVSHSEWLKEMQRVREQVEVVERAARDKAWIQAGG